jgi:hypothetical protein
MPPENTLKSWHSLFTKFTEVGSLEGNLLNELER